MAIERDNVAHWMTASSAVILFGASAIAVPQTPEAKIRIWFNAFIPLVAEGDNKTIRNFENKSFLIDPVDSSKCYSTDNRTFSSREAASSRLSVLLDLRVTGRKLEIEDKQVRVGETHRYTCDQMVETDDSPKISSTRCVTVSAVKDSTRFVKSIGITAAAPNPFFQFAGNSCEFPNLNVAARIDLDAVISYHISTRTISVSGTTGSFPAFEIYYQIDGGPTQQILTRSPKSFASPLSLFDFGLGFNTITFKHKFAPYD